MSGDLATKRLRASEADIAVAADLLRAGQSVAFPTETVYGLGADARSNEAVARIYAAKDRPRFNPLICHVTDLEVARAIAGFSAEAERLAEAFWPGPLALIGRRRPGAVGDLATAGLETVAVRAPNHPVAQKLLRALGAPIAAPSANPSGRLSPTAPDHVLAGLNGRIAAVVDGGPCAIGLESTIVHVEEDRAVLLRPGGLTVEAIEAVLGRALVKATIIATASGGPTAPGALASHYAPRAALRLAAAAPALDEAWLGFGPDPAPIPELSINLSPAGDLGVAAARLFGAMRDLDAALDGQGVIAVAPIPDHGLGLAINDRLRRAAVPATAS